MKPINIAKPLKAGAVYFKDGSEPITDCYIFLADHFVIVARDENDTRPTWYNTDLILCIEEVETMPTGCRIG